MLRSLSVDFSIPVKLGAKIIYLNYNIIIMITMPDKPKILIVYSSLSGNTEALANAIADGARSAQNVTVVIKHARDVDRSDIESASAMAFGSPTYFSYMSGEMKTLFDKFLSFKSAFEGKPVIAFATGEGGQIKCIESIEGILQYFGVKFIQRSDILSAGLAVQGRPDENTKKMAGQTGRKLADAGIEYLCDKLSQEQGITIVK